MRKRQANLFRSCDHVRTTDPTRAENLRRVHRDDQVDGWLSTAPAAPQKRLANLGQRRSVRISIGSHLAHDRPRLAGFPASEHGGVRHRLAASGRADLA
jgi:hypothetical protein